MLSPIQLSGKREGGSELNTCDKGTKSKSK